MTSSDLASGSCSLIDSKALGFYNHSAFKPVNGQQHQQSRHLDVQNGIRDFPAAKGTVSSDEEDNHSINAYQSKGKKSCVLRDSKGEPGSRDLVEMGQEAEEGNDEDDDEILVDIETTEDDDTPLKTSSPPISVECKEEGNSPLSSPKFFNSPNLLQLDSNNNNREVSLN